MAGAASMPILQPIRARIALGLAGVLLLAYAARTVNRNMDWVDEERLFIAAQKVSLTPEIQLPDQRSWAHTARAAQCIATAVGGGPVWSSSLAESAAIMPAASGA